MPATRVEHKLVPVRPAEPLAGAPERSPIPLADPIAGAAGAVGQRASDLKTGIGLAGASIVDRLLDLMPRRRPRYRRVTPLSSKRDSQRRAGFAALAFLGVVVALGVGLWLVGGALPGRDGQITDVNAGDKALAEAQGRIGQVFDEGDLIAGDAVKAQRLLREAWTELDTRRALGVATAALRPLRTQVADGLDRIYGARQVSSSVLVDLTAELSPKADIIDVVRGPDGAAYLLDKATKSIIRVDLATRSAKVVVKAGDGAGKGIGEPWQMTLGGPDILILDRDGVPVALAPVGRQGRGARWPSCAWAGRPPSATTSATRRRTPATPSPACTSTTSSIPARSRSCATRRPPTAAAIRRPGRLPGHARRTSPAFRALLVDGDVYALTSDGLTRFQSGRADDYELEVAAGRRRYPTGPRLPTDRHRPRPPGGRHLAVGQRAPADRGHGQVERRLRGAVPGRAGRAVVRRRARHVRGRPDRGRRAPRAHLGRRRPADGDAARGPIRAALALGLPVAIAIAVAVPEADQEAQEDPEALTCAAAGRV